MALAGKNMVGVAARVWLVQAFLDVGYGVATLYGPSAYTAILAPSRRLNHLIARFSRRQNILHGYAYFC